MSLKKFFIKKNNKLIYAKYVSIKLKYFYVY